MGRLKKENSTTMEIFNSAFVFLIGLSVGSFLNVLIDRLPQEKTILGRSQCDFCQKKLKWVDLIPVFSFFFLGGKCRYCRHRLSWQYPIVEVLTGITFVLTNYTMWGIMACFIVIFFSDLKYHLISDYVLLALIIFSLLSKVNIYSQIPESLASALIVSAPIFIIYFLSRERAMGQGDVYLSAIVGFLLGWRAGFIGLYISFVTGAIFGLALIVLHRKKLESKIAFGPFIIFGTITMILWGERVFDIIKKIYGF